MKIEWLYRYEGYSEYFLANPYKIKIMKETPKGYWVHEEPHRRWVSKTGRKRYAYPTKELALENYIARKLSQIKHHERGIHLAKEGLMNAGYDLDKLKPMTFMELDY